MLKNKVLLALIVLGFAVSCSNDANIGALGLDAPLEIVIDDDSGQILDEIPIDEEEDIEDEIIGVDDPKIDDSNLDDPDDEEPGGEVGDSDDSDSSDDLVCKSTKSLIVEKLDGSGELGKIGSYQGYLPASINYNYYSWSAHPIIGPAPAEYEGHFYFYEGKDGLSLNFFYNIDAGGSPNNQVSMDVSIESNGSEDKVILSDDGAEVRKVGDGSYEARMHYWYNTDGGIIGPLSGEDFRIHVKIHNVGDNKTVGFHSHDGRVLALETGASSPEAYSEFVIRYSGEEESCVADDAAQSEKNICSKNVYDQYEQQLTDSDWKQSYSDLLVARKLAVKEMADSHRAQIKDMKDAFKIALDELKEGYRSDRKDMIADQKASRKELIEKFRSERKELVNSHRARIKECRADKEKRASGECKELSASLKADRKALHGQHKSSIRSMSQEHKAARKELQSAHKVARKAMLDQRKDAINEFAKASKAERRALADRLLAEAKALRNSMMKAHEAVRSDFERDIASCLN